MSRVRGRLTLNSSPLIRVVMAAGLYLLLMWGYTVLPSAQWFAAFLALIMSGMLVFWVSEATLEASFSRTEQNPASFSPEDADSAIDAQEATPSLEASIMRLDSLKAELTLHYAQFGRDQSLINSNGLGFWHGNSNPRAR